MGLPVSRSEQKRRIKLVEKLVGELSTFSEGAIKKLPCSDDIKSLLVEVLTLKGGARKRQLKYITKILRDQPVEELYEFISKRRGKALQENKQTHEVEYLRDGLLNEAIEQYRIFRTKGMDLTEDWSSDMVREIHSILPEIDIVALKRLSNHYARTRNRRHSREIFRIIRAAMDENS